MLLDYLVVQFPWGSSRAARLFGKYSWTPDRKWTSDSTFACSIWHLKGLRTGRLVHATIESRCTHVLWPIQTSAHWHLMISLFLIKQKRLHLDAQHFFTSTVGQYKCLYWVALANLPLLPRTSPLQPNDTCKSHFFRLYLDNKPTKAFVNKPWFDFITKGKERCR